MSANPQLPRSARERHRHEGSSDPFELGDEVRFLNGIFARLNAPGGYDAFEAQVRAARTCRRPVRLSGRITRSNPEGRQEVAFDTRTLPDGVLLKACGSRRETVCPPCASLYRGDVFALVAAGLRGGKGPRMTSRTIRRCS